MSASVNSSNKYDSLIEIWKSLPSSYGESPLEAHFVTPMLNLLGVKLHEQAKDPLLGAGAGLKPDYLIWPSGVNASHLSSNSPNIPPILVIEDKKRDSTLANVSDADFVDKCKEHNDYLNATQGGTGSNGLKQYLDASNPNIDKNKLASYGLAFNGDFFQLWRRVDGLIFPLTPIQRMTEKTIPELMKQLEYVLKNPQPALVTAVWNRKGGVAKTTNTLNIGSTLALKGKKVLFIDLDTQTDLTRSFKINSDQYPTYLIQCIRDIHANKIQDAFNLAQKNIFSRKLRNTNGEFFSIDILPSNPKELELFRDPQGNTKSSTSIDTSQIQKAEILSKLINFFKAHYDYIFIDASPAKDPLMYAMLFSIDTMLIPTDYSKKTLFHAVALYQKDIPLLRQKRTEKELLGIKPWNLGLVFSNCPGDAGAQLEKCIQTELSGYEFQGIQRKTRLKIYAQTKIAEFQHLPVVCWSNSQITKLYEELVQEVFLGHNFINH
ncbi:MAG: AAA family ATPase [Snowella sp.]|nr:AAA family ATPase [Snowella sp.]